MCGIAGVIKSSPDQEIDRHVLQRMNERLRHRGPDQDGYFVDKGIGLASRRLCILDINGGRQPIANETGDIITVFNGLIYNYPVLRRLLESKGHCFRTNCDTEIIVHAYEQWGIDFPCKFNGMFSIALYDRCDDKLLLVRDRIGIKPLYYGLHEGALIFGSEIKAILAYPGFPRQWDYQAVDQFLTWEYVSGERTLFADIRKLLPGELIIFNQRQQVQRRTYWHLPENRLPHLDFATAKEKLAGLIEDAVRLRLLADVPMGALLSGGTDSSTVVAMMARNHRERVKTFSIGFDDPTYNELPYARAVADHLNCQQYDEIIKPHAVELTEDLIGFLDDPIADFSIFPTFLVSRLARQKITVALSGDGGDELFGGYDTYIAERASRLVNWLPKSLRTSLPHRLFANLSPSAAKKGLRNIIKRYFEGAVLPADLAHLRWAIFLSEVDKSRLYGGQMRALWQPENAYRPYRKLLEKPSGLDDLGRQSAVDIQSYLCENILLKADRMSMANSLEIRVPLLDHRIVELALQMPANFKIKGRRRKVILNSVTDDLLPRRLLTPRKSGFSIPMKNWLRNELRPMVSDHLSAESVERRGFFEPQEVARLCSQHFDGVANHSHRIWAMLLLELWAGKYMEGGG